MKRNSLKTLITLPASAMVWSPGSAGFVFGVVLISYFMQLDLFCEDEKPKPQTWVLPPHHKATGSGNYTDFLQTWRNFDNTFCSISSSVRYSVIKIGKKHVPIYKIQITTYWLSELNFVEDLPAVKYLLYTINPDTKEPEHKIVYNFRINDLLHRIYDMLSERSNHV